MSKLKRKAHTAKISSSPKGRKMGAKKWVNSEIIQLLNAIEYNLPAGIDQWERVSTKCNEDNRKWIRNGDSCKNKLDKLDFTKNPTGVS